MKTSHFSDWQKSLQLPIFDSISAPPSLSDIDKVLTEAIGWAAEECLRLNRNEICTTLSGGLDSSFCLAKIREIVGPKVKINTFTIGWNKKYPDICYARQVAKIFNAVHHELIPRYSEVVMARKILSAHSPEEARRLGNVAVYMAYRQLERLSQYCAIAHDGIDELLGGYWEHRDTDQTKAFTNFWARLKTDHLEPLSWKAQKFSVNVILPYLHPQVVACLTRIPVKERTSLTVSKIPLRTLAKKYLPVEILERPKLGFCNALGEE